MNYKKCLPFAMFFVFLSSTAFAAPLGDANNNGKLDLGDAIYALQSAAGLRSAGENLLDAVHMLQFLSGLNPDVIPPGAPVLQVPSDLAVGCNSSISCYVNLWWSASTDDRGVAGYYVYCDGVIVGETAGDITSKMNYFNVNQQGAVTHNCQIRAFDGGGNLSPGSNVLNITIDPSSSIPVVVSGNVNP